MVKPAPVTKPKASYNHLFFWEKMKILVIFLITCLVIVSCRLGRDDYASCEDYCNRSKVDNSNIQASVVLSGDRRCRAMVGDARDLGSKLGYCYDGPLRIDGVRQPQTHPNHEKCRALIDQAKEDCKKLPPDPSQMNQTVSGSAIYKGGKAVMINGKACTCNKAKSQL